MYIKTVEQLIDELNKIKDKSSKVRVPVYSKCVEDYIDSYICNCSIDNDKITLHITG